MVIIGSFVLDVVFLDGVTGVSQGEEAAAIIIVFLLWRLLRIVNGQTTHFALLLTIDKKFELMLTRRAKAYSSSGSVV